MGLTNCLSSAIFAPLLLIIAFNLFVIFPSYRPDSSDETRASNHDCEHDRNKDVRRENYLKNVANSCGRQGERDAICGGKNIARISKKYPSTAIKKGKKLTKVRSTRARSTCETNRSRRCRRFSLPPSRRRRRFDYEPRPTSTE